MIKAASIACGILGSLAVAFPATAQAPRRIVSFNLCADQLVLALADPAQIAGLSPYAGNPALSVVADKGASFPRLQWNAESVVNAAPDLVITGPSDRPTQAMLAAMGMPVTTIGLVGDLDAAMREAREIGQWVGHPQRGEALAASLAQAAQKLSSQASATPRTALVIERGGYAAGPQSLVAAMLAAAGLKPPPGAPSGYGGFVSLEQLLVMQPDILVLKDAPEEASDQGALFLTHPALLALYPPARRINLPARYTLCGGPALLEGLEYLARTLSR